MPGTTGKPLKLARTRIRVQTRITLGWRTVETLPSTPAVRRVRLFRVHSLRATMKNHVPRPPVQERGLCPAAQGQCASNCPGFGVPHFALDSESRESLRTPGVIHMRDAHKV